MKKVFIVGAGCLISFASIKTANADTTDDRPIFFGSLDYFGVGTAADKVNDEDNAGVAEINASGGNASASTDSSPGYGARIGFRVPIPNPNSLSTWDWGMSLGYIIGPKISPRVVETTVPETIEATITNRYIRFLAEAGDNIKLTNQYGIRLGAGVGIASGKTQQDVTLTGPAGDSGSGSKNSTGFTWEISPAFLLQLEKSTVEIGLRYAQFPTIKESDDTTEIKWSSFGAFVGVSF